MAKSKNNAIILLGNGKAVEIRIKPGLLDALTHMSDEGMDIGQMVNYAISQYADRELYFQPSLLRVPRPATPLDWGKRGLDEDGCFLPATPDQVAETRAMQPSGARAVLIAPSEASKLPSQTAVRVEAPAGDDFTWGEFSEFILRIADAAINELRAAETSDSPAFNPANDSIDAQIKYLDEDLSRG